MNLPVFQFRCDSPIGIQGEPSSEVARHPEYRLDIPPLSGGLVCRRTWNLPRGNSIRYITRWSICRTLSREIGAPVGDGNTQGLLPTFLLLFQDLDRVLCQGQGSVGVLGFQQSLYYFAVDLYFLPLHLEILFSKLIFLHLRVNNKSHNFSRGLPLFF